MIKNKESAENFCLYFHDRIKEINGLDNPLYQQILIVILMDTLSRVWTKGTENKNKVRFLKLIRDCIKWEHSDRISIPMIFYRLNQLSFVPSEQLKLKIGELFSNYQNSKINRLDNDLFYSDIQHVAESQEEIKLLKNSRHAELLYTYRNNLIHEFRKSGDGIEFSADNELPYYHRMINLDTWELVYPTRFLINLSKVALDSIQAFLIFNNLDPFAFFKFGSPW